MTNVAYNNQVNADTRREVGSIEFSAVFPREAMTAAARSIRWPPKARLRVTQHPQQLAVNAGIGTVSPFAVAH